MQGQGRTLEIFRRQRRSQVRDEMTWQRLVLDKEKQVGAGEFTFELGSKVHGVAMVKVAEGKVSHWREYWYEST